MATEGWRILGFSWLLLLVPCIGGIFGRKQGEPSAMGEVGDLVRAMGERHSAHLAVLKSKIESLELAEKNTSSAVKALVEQVLHISCVIQLTAH
jgi:hypothetical protein